MFRLLLLTCFIALPALGEVIPLDPAIAFDDLAAHYRRAPSAERIEVRATSNGQTRAEPILLQIEPPGVVQLTIGSLTVWSDSKSLRIVSRLDEQSYFERPVDQRDVLASLDAVLPPLPLPQLALAFADDPAASLTAYCVGVRWSKASVDDATRPAIISVEGSSERVEVSLKADAATGRILRMLTTLDGGMTTVELTTEPLAPAEARPIGIDTSRRDRVSDPADFVPRRAKVLIGDVLPALGFNIWRGDDRPFEEPQGPAAVVLMRHWKPGTSPRAAFDAARRLAAEHTGFNLFVALVLEPAEPNESAIADGAEQEADPLPVYRGFDPDGTIVRFTSDADQILVVIDRDRVVRAIEVLTPPISGAGADADEIERLAALIRKSISN